MPKYQNYIKNILQHSKLTNKFVNNKKLYNDQLIKNKNYHIISHKKIFIVKFRQ